ncbi:MULTISPECIES: MFS transporter [unclassified Streptomyces]|uniref:MFS transporter n=1 Tax=unclassified Streptomyces TaxID=2593676 RepID=UPI00364EF435
MNPHSRSAQDPVHAAAPGPQALTPTARWALAGLSLSVLPASLGTSIAHVGLPAMATAFDASFQAVQWIVLAYLLALTTLIVSAGRLGDLVGRRRLLLGGILLFTAASLLCAAAPTLGLLIAARAAQGLGAAVMTALAMAFVAGTVPKERVGRAMGLLGTMSAIGTALGPSLGGVLISGVGWQALFLVGVPPVLPALYLVRRHLPCDPPRSAAPVDFDHPGTLLLALTLGAYALAVTLGRGGFDAVNAALLVAAACGAALFVRVEARAASPLIRPSAFRDPVLGPGVVTGVLVSTVMMTTLVVGPFHLTRGLGLPGALAGLVLASGPVVAALTGVPAGRLADRFGAHRTTVSGLAAMAVGTASLAVLPAGVGAFGYLVPLVVVTAGYAVFQTANNTAVMASVPADRRGVVSGVLNLSRNLGLITGASVMGAVFAFASGAADITTAGPASVAAGTRITYAVAAGLTVLALAVAAGSGGLVRRRAARRAARLPSARRT